MVQEKHNEVICSILSVIEESKLTSNDIQVIIPDLLYSIGNSLEGNPILNGLEEVEIRYSERPTLGNALMAMSTWMKSTWKIEKRKKKCQKKTTPTE